VDTVHPPICSSPRMGRRSSTTALRINQPPPPPPGRKTKTEKIMARPAIHGFRDGQSPVAPPVATHSGPDGAKKSARATCPECGG